MKRKRFYNNKERNQKWTEPITGRTIDFADKYANENQGENIYSQREKERKKHSFSKEKFVLRLKKFGLVLCALILVGTGYTVMDVAMDRKSMPQNSVSQGVGSDISSVKLEIKSEKADSLSLDGSVMLKAVADEAVTGGFSSVTFDIKREDGTIGYESSLATIASVGAVASPARDIKASVAQLNKNDILPVGRICCYRDNVLSNSYKAYAIKNGEELYQDKSGGFYLNPNNNSVYQYIKSIVEECTGYGIRVFILDKTALPDDISPKYNDGFDELSKKLSSDLGSKIKFLSQNDISITSNDLANINSEIKQKMKKNIADNQIYCISCTKDNKQKLKNVLDDLGYSSYILQENN